MRQRLLSLADFFVSSNVLPARLLADDRVLKRTFCCRVAGNNNPSGAVRSRSSECVSCVLAFGLKSALQGLYPGSAPMDLIFSPYQYQRLILANRGVAHRH